MSDMYVKKKIYVSQLAIEVTRRCNMACDHCMRGDAQNIDIDLSHIDKIIDMCDSISNVTFTGGEPTLNLEAIRYTFEKMRHKYGYIPGFYIVTNGKANSRELAHLILDVWCDIDEMEQEMSGVAISVDDFHENVDYAHNPLRALACYKPDKEHDPHDNNHWVANIGRASETGVGVRPFTPSTELYITADCDSVYIDDMLLAANGNVTSSCDYAYDDESVVVCHIDDFERFCCTHD